MKTLRIAFYGKGGIGKSTIASNLAAAYAVLGKSVLLIGCDPKSDSCTNIMGRKIDSVLDILHTSKSIVQRSDIIHYGFRNIACIECGGPRAGMGCAGLGITATINELHRLHIYDESWDIIIYDVLGDVVCGGFSVPIRKKLIDKMFIVTSDEYMSLYACNNLLKSVNSFSKTNTSFFAGLIYNARNNCPNLRIREEFSLKTNTSVVASIPYLSLLQQAEWERKTLFEKYPDADATVYFIELARKILSQKSDSMPLPLDEETFEQLLPLLNTQK